MLDFFFTARRPDGRTLTEHRKGDSATQVHKTLVSEGYTEIVLHTDNGEARHTDYDASSKHITPAQYVKFRTQHPKWGLFIFVFRMLIRSMWHVELIGLCSLAMKIWIGTPWRYWEYLFCLIVLGFPLICAGAVALWPTSVDRFYAMLTARAWGRWNEVLRIAPTITGIADELLAFQTATALAGLGRLDEALAVLEPFSDGARMPLGLYYDQLADVYTVAGKPEEALASAEKAYEVAPDELSIQIDLVLHLARLQRDIPRCKQLLAHIRQNPLSDLQQVCLASAEGIVAFEDQRPSAALPWLNQAIQELAPFARAIPPMGCHIDRAHMYLALANKRLNNEALAGKHFRKAKPRLIAFRSRELMERCRRELGELIVGEED